jgi:hypothetical protein
MSPLQFQKRLRLYEAQRLMLAEGKSAETAALAVAMKARPSLTGNTSGSLGNRRIVILSGCLGPAQK